MVLSTFSSSLENMHNFYNPYNLGMINIYFIIDNPTLNLFCLNNEICPICYIEIFIPTHSQICNHVFCLCCILRWLNSKNTCPLCRQKITEISFLDSKAKNGIIIINSNQFHINNNNHQNDKSDSILCIVCKKSGPINQLVLCQKCKFNLIHINCAGISTSEITKYICHICRE